MTDMPERIWTVHWNTDGAVMNGAWADTVRHFGGGVEYVRADLHRSLALDVVAAGGQASDAYDAQWKAEVMAEKLSEALRVIANGTTPEADPDTGELIECWMGTEEMQEIAAAALAEYEASK